MSGLRFLEDMLSRVSFEQHLAAKCNGMLTVEQQMGIQQERCLQVMQMSSPSEDPNGLPANKRSKSKDSILGNSHACSAGSAGGSKPATLETGAVIQVPLFVNQGEKVRVDTREGTYTARVSS